LEEPLVVTALVAGEARESLFSDGSQPIPIHAPGIVELFSPAPTALSLADAPVPRRRLWPVLRRILTEGRDRAYPYMAGRGPQTSCVEPIESDSVPAPTFGLVQEFLEYQAARRGHKTALVCGDQRLTYRQLDGMANSLANALGSLGVNRGDRVVIWLGNSVEAVVAIFATLKAGGVFVVINRTTKPQKLAYILNDCRAAALVTDTRALSVCGQGHLSRVESLRGVVICGDRGGMPVSRRSSHGGNGERGEGIEGERGTVNVVHFFPPVPGPLSEPAERPPCRNIDLDLACLIYTSGTTGEPKGVMCDHSNLLFATGSIILYLENDASDVVLNVLPLSFDYGLYQLLMTFRFGGTLVLENSFAFPVAILERIERERVTGFPGVPTLFATLLQMDLTRFNLTSLRYLTNTGAALPTSHIQELRRRLPHARLYSMYGLTETKRTLYLPPNLVETKPGSVGIAIPGTEVWVEDGAGRRLGPGEVGELVVRGRHVMRGYWGAPEATNARFRPGPVPGERLCYTGDLFRTDEDGCLYFVGRKDDIIKSRGEKVSPKEVENVLHALPGVAEATVLGVPDPLLGQAIKAVIVRSAARQLTAADVLAHCRAHLEDFMVPRFVEFKEALPRSPSGKVRKEELA
jgi:acyl-CoA synthetase (AMP-forming)/AMP-acid ligase II